MIICVCNQISDKDLCASLDKGISTCKGLQKELGVCSSCGNCAKLIQCWLDRNYRHYSSANCADFKSIMFNMT